jgi:HAD superfamily phosphatase (TIGR01668 family)
MTWLRPDAFVRRLHDIKADDLIAGGVTAAIIDLDDTIVGYRHPQPLPEVTEWMEGALQRGLRIIIVSNNTRAWVREVAGRFGVAFVHKAYKPLPIGLRRAIRVLGIDRRSIVVIGDQLFTDVLGAKLLGLNVILTEPIVAERYGSMRFLRFLERLVLGAPSRSVRSLRHGASPAHRPHDPEQDDASDERDDDAPNVESRGANVPE